MGNLNNIKEYWNNVADSWFTEEQRETIIRKIFVNPKSAFHPKTWDVISRNVLALNGMRICVPSSGDNQAVFAFALLGASVTSCDISEKQLEIAETIARHHSLDIEFVCDDTMHLNKIKSNEYDFVYTSNGVHVWINDLKSMYDNIYRILKPKGKYIMYEIHPYTRPFDCTENKLVVKKRYDDIGPFDKGTTYAWRTQDILNAIVSSKLVFKHLEEIYDDGFGTFWHNPDEDISKFSEDELKELFNWRINPVSAIPQWMTIYAEKE
jgi:SAM-dependent methyltransferase